MGRRGPALPEPQSGPESKLEPSGASVPQETVRLGQRRETGIQKSAALQNGERPQPLPAFPVGKDQNCLRPGEDASWE